MATITTTKNSRNGMFAWVSEEDVQSAREALENGEKKCCPMCRPYGTPGYIVNANQVVKCFQCNKSKK